MRLLVWLVSLPIFLAVIVFVLQNRMQVSISFWPFDLQATLPVSVLSLGLLMVGFLLGSLTSAFPTFFVNRENKKMKKQIEGLNKKLEEKTPIESGPTILYQGRYQTVPPEKPAAPPSLFARIFKKGKPAK